MFSLQPPRHIPTLPFFASRLAYPRRTVCLRLLTVRAPHAHHWQLDPNFRTHTSGSRHGRFVPQVDLCTAANSALSKITAVLSAAKVQGRFQA